MTDENAISDGDVLTGEGAEIDPGVVEGQMVDPGINEEKPAILSRREEVIQEIVERNRVEAEGEPGVVSGGENESTPIEDKVLMGDVDDPMIDIVVDGVTRQMPQSAILKQGIRTAQKESAADARMEMAATREQALRAREAALMQRENEQQQVNVATPVADDAMRKKAEAALKRLNGYDPDEEDIEAFVELIQPTPAIQVPAPRINTDTVVAQVEQRMELNAAQKAFSDTNNDLMSDPRLRERADKYSGMLREKQPSMSVSENLTRAAELTREWMKMEDDVQRNLAAEQTTSRVARKSASVKQIPRAAAARHVAQAEPAPLTRSEQIAQMRKARGQPAI